MSHGLKHKTYAQKRTLTRQDATACTLTDIHTNTELEKEKPNLVCSACSITCTFYHTAASICLQHVLSLFSMFYLSSECSNSLQHVLSL